MNRYQSLFTELQALEAKTINALREEIYRSKIKSKHIQDCNIMSVNIFGYTELAVINDKLTFMDANGLQYSINADCNLDDLVELLVRVG